MTESLEPFLKKLFPLSSIRALLWFHPVLTLLLTSPFNLLPLWTLGWYWPRRRGTKSNVLYIIHYTPKVRQYPTIWAHRGADCWLPCRISNRTLLCWFLLLAPSVGSDAPSWDTFRIWFVNLYMLHLFFLFQAKYSCELMHSSWSIHMMDWEPALGKKLSLGQASSDESKRIFNSNFLVHFPSVVGKSYQRDKLRGNEVTRCSIKISMRHHHPVTFSIVILPNFCKTSSDGFKAVIAYFLNFPPSGNFHIDTWALL